MSQAAVTQNNIFITTSDGYELSALEVVPSDRNVSAVVQVHAGTNMAKEFYLKYATFLAEDYGLAVVLFDYRSVRESRSKSLRGFKTSVADWGTDAESVLQWIRSKYSRLRIHLFAHSMGGQIYGLMPSWDSFYNVVFIASSSGNYNNFIPSYRFKSRLMSNSMFPIVLPLLGYAPGWLGLGPDLAKGVAKDWWHVSKQNMLMADHLKAQRPDHSYDAINKEISAIFFSDDHMATAKTVPNIQRSYPNATVKTQVITPDMYRLQKLGHFGLFKKWSKGDLWHDIARKLVAQS